MSITKDSKEWLAALALVPERWRGGECERCFDHLNFWRRGYHFLHAIPPPDITPDLLYAIRRAIEARGFEWTLSFDIHPESRQQTYRLSVWSTCGKLCEIYAETEAATIIRAAASLQEAK